LLIDVRKIQPDVIFRARGVGNYADYMTPEDIIPGGPDASSFPWFVIHRLSRYFAFDPDGSEYKSGEWIVRMLIDVVAKGGNLMVSYGPDANGNFHPKAIEALEDAGAWLKVNGEGIFGTRPRDGDTWREGAEIFLTRSKDRRFVYAFITHLHGSMIRLHTVNPRPRSIIRMLGVDRPLTWSQEGNQLTINLPFSLQDEARRPCKYACAIKIEVVEGSD
jgi:alpha-L-fucosidase